MIEKIIEIIESSFRQIAAIFKGHDEMSVKNAEAHKSIEKRNFEKRKKLDWYRGV